MTIADMLRRDLGDILGNGGVDKSLSLCYDNHVF